MPSSCLFLCIYAAFLPSFLYVPNKLDAGCVDVLILFSLFHDNLQLFFRSLSLNAYTQSTYL